MSTIAERLTQLNTIKSDIKTAINNKGGEVGDDFSTYANAINNLSTGGKTYLYPEFFNTRTNNNTDYGYLFYFINFGKGLFNESFMQFIENLDISKVTNMKHMLGYSSFSYAPRKYLDLSKWNTENLESLSSFIFSRLHPLKDIEFRSLA